MKKKIPSNQNLSYLQTPFRMAQEVGEDLGAGKILL
jgi:hypothetical protein